LFGRDEDRRSEDFCTNTATSFTEHAQGQSCALQGAVRWLGVLEAGSGERLGSSSGHLRALWGTWVLARVFKGKGEYKKESLESSL
jgi:hypothetical protein